MDLNRITIISILVTLQSQHAKLINKHLLLLLISIFYILIDDDQGYPRGGKELLGPLSAKFGPWETFDWFSSRGIDLKTEKDGRVFPITDRSV